MASTFPLIRPLFEPTDILGPHFLPTPLQSTDADSRDSDDVIMEEEPTRPPIPRMDFPPMDYEEEPSVVGDEFKAMPRAAQNEEQSFVSSGLLDLDEPRLSKVQAPPIVARRTYFSAISDIS